MLNPYQKRKLKNSRPNLNTLSVENKGNIVTIYEYLTGNTTRSGGRARVALCPFHGDRNPSFALYEDTATYFCFSCQETGDSINLIMKLRECDFTEAKEIVNLI